MKELSTEIKANEVHERAIGFYKISEQYGYKFLMEVKTIRDEKLYKELGFETFEDYTLQVFNYSRETISKRIKSAEVFGEENIEALRHLGTQKVNELATMPEEQRNHVIENGIETNNGNKSIDEATTRELEEYKKRTKDLEQRNESLSKQAELANRKIEELEDAEPEVIERYMEPDDYQETKQALEQSLHFKKITEQRNEKLEQQIKEMKQQRDEITEKSQKYDDLNKAINNMNAKLTEGQQRLKAQKEIYDLIKGSEKVIREVAPLCYLAFAKDIIDNDYAKKPIEKIIKDLKDMANRLQSQINQGDVIDV